MTDVGINEAENEAINELRQRLKGDIEPELYDDKYFFLRFLRARDMKINNAEAMLRKTLAWREKYDIKDILKYKKTEVTEKYFVNVLLGHDKNGCVIRYSPCGTIDFIGMLSSCTFEDVTKLFAFEAETDTFEVKKQSEKLGKNIDQLVYIYDFKNLSFATVTDKKVIYYLIHFLNMFMNHYPERLKACYLLNVSMYFNLVFSWLKTMLPKTIVDKLHMYSDDSYKKDLLEVIDADVLPAFLGGNRTDPDGNPECLTVIKSAETVPRSFYLQKSKKTLAKLPGVKKITLANAAFYEEYLEVKEAGSCLEWEFETKSRDIGFGLFYNELDDEEEKVTELVPILRIDTELYPETGTYRCSLPGKYVIVFDNTYSWVRQKEVYFRIKVLTPKEHGYKFDE